MLETGISSTARIARSWGLADDDDVARAEGEVVSGPSQSRMPPDIEAIVARAMGYAEARRPIPQSEAAAARTGEGVGKVINDAFRAAGLIR